MNISQQIFTIFFAIFWGFLGSVVNRWKPFNFPLIFLPIVRRRILLSFMFFNIIPIFYFSSIIYLLCNYTGYICFYGYWSTFSAVIMGIIPSFGIFSFYRFWLSFIEMKPSWYYKNEQKDDNEIQNNNKIDPTIEDLNLKNTNWCLNMLFGLLYFLFALSPLVILCLSSYIEK